MATNKRKPSRADVPQSADDPKFFDFNVPAALFAAPLVSPESIASLLEALDRADETFDANARDGALAALEATVMFLRTVAGNRRGRFSRPLEMLHDELKGRRRPADKKRILLRDGSGPAGRAGRPSIAAVRGAAAYAMDRLMKDCGMSSDSSADTVAAILVKSGFPFAKGRSKPRDGVKAWRRDKKHKSFLAAAPVDLSGHANVGQRRITGWLTEFLARSGYGVTA